MPRQPRVGLMRWLKGMMLKHMPLMITCREFEDFILDYLEETLPERQRKIFELHIKVCRECRSYLAAYRNTMALAKGAFADPEQPLPDDVPEDLVKAILAAREA